MATNLITSLPAACFSNDLPDVRVSTDADFVVCTVRDANNELVIQLKSYPYDGEAAFADLRSVVGQWLLANCLLSQVFTLVVSESWDEQRAECSAEVLVAYCAYGTQGVEFEALIAQRFLSTLQSKVIYPNIKEQLSCLAPPNADLSLRVEGFTLGDDGKPAAFSTELAAEESNNEEDGTSEAAQPVADRYSNATYEVSLETIAAKVGAKPLAFTCYVGSRVFTFYAAKEPLPWSRETPPCAFLFRNAFNAVETAAFRGVTTAKQEVEREEAVSGGRTAFYDESTAQSFEVQSAALAPDFAAWLAQLLASPDVRLWQRGKAWDELPRILITESTYEISDADDDQRTVKFTWRYADDTPQFAPAQLLADGIFSAPYNPLFS